MLRAYKYRIYPNEEQKVLFAKTFGCCRFAYNWALETKIKAWEQEKRTLSCYDLQKIMANTLKREHEWLNEVSSHAIDSAIKNVDAAFTNFFKHGFKFPKFKKKTHRQTFQSRRTHKVDFKKGVLNIAKIRNIKTIFHRTFKGIIKNVTISLERDGKYFASILVESSDSIPTKKSVKIETSIGIDTGITTLAVCSNGMNFSSPHFQERFKQRIKILYRKLGRKEKGSKSFDKTRRLIAKTYSKIANQRLDYLHKISYQLTHKNQVETICVENLIVANIAKKKHLAYYLADVSIGELYRQLKYKCEWYGLNYIEVDRFAPTSKTCNVCGWKYKDLKLKEREWVCPKCGTHHDRDFNASINIKNFGLKTLLSE